MHKVFKNIISLTAVVILISIIIVTSYIIAHTLFPRKYAESVSKYCENFEVEEALAFALIKAESNFNPDAKSSAGAKGLMQLTDETFSYCFEKAQMPYSAENPFSPEQNIHAGIWYLSFLIDKYDGNIKNAVAAYNAGSANVDRWLASTQYSPDGKNLKKIPFGETLKYTQKIVRYKKIYEFIY